MMKPIGVSLLFVLFFSCTNSSEVVTKSPPEKNEEVSTDTSSRFFFNGDTSKVRVIQNDEDSSIISKPIKSKYVHFPDIGVSLIPPLNYRLAKEYNGFYFKEKSLYINRNGVGTSEMMNSIVDGFELQGAKEIDVTNFNINYNGQTTTAYCVSVEAAYKQYVFIVGDSMSSVSLSGIASLNQLNEQKNLLESFKSILVKPVYSSDLSETQFFEIDLSGTNLKSYPKTTDWYFYSTADNASTVATKDDYAIYIRRGPDAVDDYQPSIYEILNQLIEAIQRNTKLSVIDEGELKIDNKDSHFIIANSFSPDSGVSSRMIIVVTKDGDKTYIFEGICYGEFDSTTKLLHKVIKSIKLK